MQNVEKGAVIEHKATGVQIRVSEILTNPKFERDGVPCVVEGYRLTGARQHESIAFGCSNPTLPVEDWRNWKIVSPAEEPARLVESQLV